MPTLAENASFGKLKNISSKFESVSITLPNETVAAPAAIASKVTLARIPSPLTPVVPDKALKMVVIVAKALSTVPPPKVCPAPRKPPSVAGDALSSPAGPKPRSSCHPKRSETPLIRISSVNTSPTVTLLSEGVTLSTGEAWAPTMLPTSRATAHKSFLII